MEKKTNPAEEITRDDLPLQAEETPKAERPVWQRLLAWLGLILFLGVLALCSMLMMRGG